MATRYRDVIGPTRGHDTTPLGGVHPSTPVWSNSNGERGPSSKSIGGGDRPRRSGGAASTPRPRRALTGSRTHALPPDRRSHRGERRVVAKREEEERRLRLLSLAAIFAANDPSDGSETIQGWTVFHLASTPDAISSADHLRGRSAARRRPPCRHRRRSLAILGLAAAWSLPLPTGIAASHERWMHRTRRRG